MQLCIGVIEQEFTMARLREWPAQWVYKAFVCISWIFFCTPDLSPAILDVPSYPWPCNLFNDKSTSDNVLVIAFTIFAALTL